MAAGDLSTPVSHLPSRMTLRLFHHDPSLRIFSATVLELRDGGRSVVLDRTAFYPASGGQPWDQGVLRGREVLEVVEEGDTIVHRLSDPLGLGPGDRVEGRVDDARRRDLSQQHTGQHLLSALFADAFGLDTVGVHLGEAASTLDLAGPEVDPGVVREVEERANRMVGAALPVTVAEEDAAEAARTGLRKPTGRTGPVRVVTIRGVDRSACGGTHVATTAEIGAILFVGRGERIRGNARLTFLCGDRVLRRAREDGRRLADAARLLGSRSDEVPHRVESLLARLKEAEGALRRMEAEAWQSWAQTHHAAALPGPDGLRRLECHDPPGGMEALQAMGQAVARLPAAVLVGVVSDPPGVLLAASEDSAIHVGHLLRRVLAEVGGRGGGSPRVARGSVPHREALERVVGRLRRAAPGEGEGGVRESTPLPPHPGI